MEPEPVGVVAAYGRSCEVCVKAKCKCLFRTGNDKCERCYRLNKDCKQPQARRRRATGRKGAANGSSRSSDQARTARLEDKLDRVLESLKPFPRGPISPTSVSDQWPQRNDPQPSTSRQDFTITPPSDTSNPPGNYVPLAEVHAREFGSARPARVWKMANVSPALADEHLHEFRTQHLEWFPFVYISPTTTSEQLRNDRPFLWLNIMLLTSHSTTNFLRMGDVLRREIAEAMVVDSEKSVDLLLGLLVFMGWYHAHCQCTDGSVKLSLSLLTQLAISLVFDLQLNKREPKPPSQSMLGVATHKALRLPYPRTLESKRAGVAVFLLSSMLSVHLQRLDPLRWTPYLDDNLRELEQNPEWPGDLVLVQQTRMQLVVDRIHCMHWSAAMMEANDNLQLPATAFVQTLQAQLDRIKGTLIPEHQINTLLTLHHLHARININESSPVAPSSVTPLSLSQTHALTSSLSAARAFLATFLALPPLHTLPTISFPMTFQLMHCLSVVFDLAILDNPGWDKHLVRSEVDVLGTLDRVAAGFEEAAPGLSEGVDGEENAFMVYGRFLRQAKGAVRARLEEGGQVEAEVEAAPGIVGGSGVGGVGEGGLFDLEFLDNPLFWNFAGNFEGVAV